MYSRRIWKTLKNRSETIQRRAALLSEIRCPIAFRFLVLSAAVVLVFGAPPAGGVNTTRGMVPVRADLEPPEPVRFAGLQDRSRPVIPICLGGAYCGWAATLLDDMGFADVVYIEGGMAAWVEAGNPIQVSHTHTVLQMA